MGDEAPARIDDVGVAVFAYLDAGYHVPYQLQVDLGDDDARLRGCFDRGDRHVWFGPVAEVSRTVVSARRPRGRNAGVTGAVDPASDDVERKARHLELLSSVGVHVSDVRYGRRLAQQPAELRLALLERRRLGR